MAIAWIEELTLRVFSLNCNANGDVLKLKRYIVAQQQCSNLVEIGLSTDPKKYLSSYGSSTLQLEFVQPR